MSFCRYWCFFLNLKVCFFPRKSKGSIKKSLYYVTTRIYRNYRRSLNENKQEDIFDFYEGCILLFYSLRVKFYRNFTDELDKNEKE